MKYLAVTNANLTSAIMEEAKAKKDEYSLIILGAQTGESASILYATCPVSMLVIYSNDDERDSEPDNDVTDRSINVDSDDEYELKTV